MEGGGKEGTEIHNKVVEDLKTDFGFSEEEARAVKSVLYDEAKEKISVDEPGFNLARAKYMAKQLTKKRISKITPEEIKARIEKIQKTQEERKASKKTAGRKRKTSKKVSKKRKTSKKVSKKIVKKAGSKKTVKKTSKKASKKKTSKKVIKK
jgi:hypothetical protein